MFSGMSIVAKGLVCAGLGLAGTFLVLILVYITIRVLQRVGAKG